MQERPDSPETHDFDDDGLLKGGESMLRTHIEFETALHMALLGDEPIDRKMRDMALSYMGGMRFTVCALMELLKHGEGQQVEMMVDLLKRQGGNSPKS